MAQNPSGGRVRRFADLADLYAEQIATPEYQAAFGDPLGMSVIMPGDEPGEHHMPEPFAAQADCGAIVATLFDLFADTRLEPLAADIAWGFVNSFHFVAGRLEGQEDRAAREVGDMARRPDASEVFNRELEEQQLLCQSLAEQRAAVECMRDYAAEMYRVLSGRPWSAARGSTLNVIGDEIDRQQTRLREEFAAVSNDFTDTFAKLKGRITWHRWVLGVVALIGIAGGIVATCYKNSVSALPPQPCASAPKPNAEDSNGVGALDTGNETTLPVANLVPNGNAMAAPDPPAAADNGAQSVVGKAHNGGGQAPE